MPSATPQSADAAQAVRILHLEDNQVEAELIRARLAEDGFDAAFKTVVTEIQFRSALTDFAPQLILSDFSLPGFDGLSALRIARSEAPDIPFIFVSGTIGEERAIEALKRGAVDYVLKDNLLRLVPAIRGAVRQAEDARARDLAEQMLRRSESRLQAIIDTSGDWIWECDRDGRFTFSSPSISEILGYRHHEVLGRRATDYVDPSEELRLQTNFAELENGGDVGATITLRWRHKSGKTRWLERKAVALRDDNGVFRGMRGSDRDVTVRMAQEVRIRRLNRALRFLSGASSAVIRLRDRQQLLKESCRLAVRVGGYQRAKIYLLPGGSEDARPLVHSYGSERNESTKWSVGATLPEGTTPVTQALATGQPVIVSDITDASDLGIRVADREALLERGVRACITLPLVIEGTSIGVVELHSEEPDVFGEAELALLKQVAENITFALQYLHSKESAERFEYFDPLTALANRSLYLQRLGGAIEDARRANRRVALLVFDICDLGMINDGLGHHSGDLLLQLVAERSKSAFSDTGALCRLGGDRFAAFVDVGSSAEADRLPERLGLVFDPPFELDGHELRVSATGGIAEYPDDGMEAETLLQAAQMAWQHAKETGDRCLRHRPNMSARASERLSLTNELRRAVAERGFALHYQPKVALASGLLEGVEALLRWPRENQDAVSPVVFVPMLESLGLIEEVGAWVIVQALRESADWATTAGGVRVAVNVSQKQLDRDDFADRVLQLVDGIPNGPRRLELEITESTLMADPRKASSSLARLREAGVSVAIDDFGTGHSSLKILAGLPADVLKIDRSFVCDLATNRNHRLIVQTTIGLAKSLGMKTVAEGVEMAEQAELLHALGCDAVQGYLIGRPAAAATTVQWLAMHQAAPITFAPSAESQRDRSQRRR
ncbi:MAG TPA: EAL domain-containing protein [Gammaproteobacteria bacterium]|nr:EAL domain-containing protein [Gammaproteobacteria bacterium]